MIFWCSPLVWVNDGHTRLSRTLRGLTSKLRTLRRRIQAHSVQSVKMRSARVGTELAEGRKDVEGSMGGASSSSFAREKIAMAGRPGGRERVERVPKAWHGRYKLM